MLIFFFMCPFLSGFLVKMHSGVYLVVVISVLLLLKSTPFLELVSLWCELDCTCLFLSLLTLMVLYLVHLLVWSDRPVSSLFLGLGAFTLGSFFTKSFFFFFLFFECSVLFLSVVLLFWGGHSSRYEASWYFMIYSLVSGFPLLFGIVGLSFQGLHSMSVTMCFWLSGKGMLSFFILLGFMVKMPLFPFHLWLIKTHLESPTYGSMYLAAVSLKVGVFGFVRSFVHHSSVIKNFYSALVAGGCLMVALYCLRCPDLKLLVAYSSVVHMGMCLFMVLQKCEVSLYSCCLLMFSHGVVSSGLFFSCSVMYQIQSSRSFMAIKGMLGLVPYFSVMTLFLVYFNMSGPPSLNFISELFGLMGVLTLSWGLFTLSVLSSFLCGVYCIYYYYLVSNSSSSTGGFSISLKNYQSGLWHIYPILSCYLWLSWMESSL